MLWQCISCLKTLESYEIGYDRLCPSCGKNTKILGPIYVNVYLTDLAYGGPEEGGWWYNCGEPVESTIVGTEEQANELVARLRAGKYSNVGRRPKHSVLSQGEYDICIEQHIARPFPDRKPHYE
jgi:hypothetical protein